MVRNERFDGGVYLEDGWLKREEADTALEDILVRHHQIRG
jgi:hypothetical protein